MMDLLDELDIALLDRVKSTECKSMRDVIRPFLLKKSESVLRTRVRYLELYNLIKLEKHPRTGRIRCLSVER